MLIRFDDTDAAIEIPDEGEFAGVLRAAASDWPFREAAAAGTPVARVRKAGARYAIAAPGEDAIEASAVSAACSVIVDAVRAYIDAHPTRLCLHCASVLLGGRLVVFPSRFRAGKSTLVARLAAGGHAVFGDDALPLSDDDRGGVALGLAPRLRLPLPVHASQAFRRFVREHAGPEDGYYQYLDLRGGLAARGATAPLGAVVLLDRRPRGPALLSAASRSAALQALITRNFARSAPAGDLLDRLHGVMERLPRFTLHYSDLDEAAALLEATFGAWPPRLGALARKDPPAAAADGPADRSARIGRMAGARLRRKPGVKLQEVDGELFLADASGMAIHHLNAVGAGLWNLLAEPLAEDEAVEVLGGAFPDVDRAVIGRDVAALFDALAASGFAEAVPSGDCIGAGGSS